jgi:hypothetical protein
VTLDWGSLPVEQVTPSRPPDLFAARPVVVVGRYRGAAQGTLTLRGLRGGRPFTRQVAVSFPRAHPENGALAQLWARHRIEDLSAEDWTGAQQGHVRPDLRERITQLGLDYRLVTPYTAFVAVEERTIVEGGRARTVHVPVEMPHNVSPEGVFGSEPQGKMMAGSGGGALAAVSAREMVRVLPAPAAPEARSREVPRAEGDIARDASRDELRTKLHPGLLRVVECYLDARSDRARAACAADRDGRVDVQIWLRAAPDDALLKRLAEAGFVRVAPRPGGRTAPTMVEGRIAIDRLGGLVRMPEVTLVAAARR